MLSSTSSDIQGLCSDLPSALDGPKINMQALWYQTLGSVRPLVAFVLSSLYAIKGALQVTAVSL